MFIEYIVLKTHAHTHILELNVDFIQTQNKTIIKRDLNAHSKR